VCTLRPQSYQSPGENIYPTTKEECTASGRPCCDCRSKYRVTACQVFPGRRPTRGLLHSGGENEMSGRSGLLRTGPKTGRASTLSTTSLHVVVRGTRHEGRFREIQADSFDNKCASQNHVRLEASRRLAENSFAEQEDVSQNSCPSVSSEQSILLCTPPIYIFAKASAETRTTQDSPEQCVESHLLAALQAHPLQSQWKPGRYCNGNLSTPLRANLCRHRGVAHRHKATPRWLEERGGGTRHTIAHQKKGFYDSVHV